MSAEKINIKEVRRKAAAKNIFTLSELARTVGCSRPAIYFAIERPSRFPKVYSKMMEVIGG